MKEMLDAMAQAMADQAIALGTTVDQVRALKQTLARKFPDLADELKGQMADEQEQSLKDFYELQVSLAKVREAIAQLQEAKAPALKVATEKKGRTANARAGARK